MSLRLKGQEIILQAVSAGQVVTEVSAIASFNDSVMLELKEDQFLGEPVNRFDQVLNGFSGDFEFQLEEATWTDFVNLIVAKAKREQPDLLFNMVRTDFYPNGQTAVIVYQDVSWGAIPTTIASKNDFVKVKMEFRCSKRSVSVNSLP